MFFPPIFKERLLVPLFSPDIGQSYFLCIPIGESDNHKVLEYIDGLDRPLTLRSVVYLALLGKFGDCSALRGMVRGKR